MEKKKYVFPTTKEVIDNLNQLFKKLEARMWLFKGLLKPLKKLHTGAAMINGISMCRRFFEVITSNIPEETMEVIGVEAEKVFRRLDADMTDEEEARLEELGLQLAVNNKHLKAELVRILMLVDTEGLEEMVGIVNAANARSLINRGEAATIEEAVSDPQ